MAFLGGWGRLLFWVGVDGSRGRRDEGFLRGCGLK